MARVTIEGDHVDLDDPTLVEGLPGAGLVGKIAADHLVRELDTSYYGAVYCDGLPPVAVYQNEDSTLRPPVRLYAAESEDLLVLQSDIPVSPSSAPDFASCLTDWIVDSDVLPLYLSGLGGEKEGAPNLYGVSTAGGEALLEEAGIVPPADGGLVSGPTGALLHHAEFSTVDSVGLIIECDGQFPDPEAARVLLDAGIAPLTGTDVDTEALTEQAEEIREARERLARQMGEADDASSEAQPLRMFQ
ncbi:3-isopropylmalate dehydratase [Halobacteriales archaeon QS_3_64_16]|nr:MAG: 3-isopropylmalate dehydratase [Halobacteriales archaeon QS_3_64_16]